MWVTTFTSLLGSEFVDNYPGVFDDLHDLDNSLKYLLLGLPRWFPLESLAKANLARHRLDNAIDSIHKALDMTAINRQPDQPWRELHDVSQEIKARCAIFEQLHLPPAVRGPLYVCILRISLPFQSLLRYSAWASQNLRADNELDDSDLQFLWA